MALNKFAPLRNLTQKLIAPTLTTQTVARNMSSEKLLIQPKELTKFETLSVSTPKPFVAHVEFNRPKRLNAFSKQMWMEIKECFEGLSLNPDCRAIVLSATGKVFTAGIDLNDMMKLGQELADIDDPARKGVYLERIIKLYQDCITSLEACAKPVIVAVHSACVGAGANLITAADIRYCTQDAFFSVKEVDIGMAADVGALQRLPRVIGNQSLVRELCYTGRRLPSEEALSCGLVSKVFETKEQMIDEALALAANIAEKSPIAVQATKANLVYSQDKTVQEGLDHIRQLNKLYLQSEDFGEAVTAQFSKGDKPTFSKL